MLIFWWRERGNQKPDEDVFGIWSIAASRPSQVCYQLPQEDLIPYDLSQGRLLSDPWWGSNNKYNWLSNKEDTICSQKLPGTHDFWKSHFEVWLGFLPH